MQLGVPTRSMSTPLLHNLQQPPTHLTQKTVSRLSRIPSFFLQGNLFCVFSTILTSYHFSFPWSFQRQSSIKLLCVWN